MERLTIKNWRNLDPWETCGQDNYCKRGCHDQGGCTKGCIVPRIYDRLAAYEDTGLDPEEIKDNMEMFRAYRHICAGHEPEHIRDLLLAEKDGIPKCGTKVFALTTVGYWHKKYAKPEITECFVTTHRLAKNGETKFSVEGYLDSGSYYKAVFGKTSMGKTVFLTRKEAEAALAGKDIIPCKHGLSKHRNEIGEDEVYCELNAKWMNVTLGDCLGNCESEAALAGKGGEG